MTATAQSSPQPRLSRRAPLMLAPARAPMVHAASQTEAAVLMAEFRESGVIGDERVRAIMAATIEREGGAEKRRAQAVELLNTTPAAPRVRGIKARQTIVGIGCREGLRFAADREAVHITHMAVGEKTTRIVALDDLPAIAELFEAMHGTYADAYATRSEGTVTATVGTVQWQLWVDEVGDVRCNAFWEADIAPGALRDLAVTIRTLIAAAQDTAALAA